MEGDREGEIVSRHENRTGGSAALLRRFAQGHDSKDNLSPFLWSITLQQCCQEEKREDMGQRKAVSSGVSFVYCLMDLIGESVEIGGKVSPVKFSGPHEVAPSPGRKGGQKGVLCKGPAEIGKSSNLCSIQSL